MLYRPSFCSHCGEKIERSEWPLLVSRRFCDVCANDYKLTDWFSRVVTLGAILLGAAGLFGLFRPVPHVENTSSTPSVAGLADKGPRPPSGDFNATPQRIQQSQQ